MSKHLIPRTSLPTDTHELDYILVDGSGSMMEKWWDFLAAAQTYVDNLKTNNLNSHLIAHVFDDSDMEMIQRDCALADCTSFVDDPLGSHFGSTPLYDAINLLGRRLRELDPKKAAILIVTDGDDSCSKTSVVQARAILDWIKAKGWQVTFIGCDFNNDRQGRALGMSEANTIGVQKKLLADAAKNLATKRRNYSTMNEDITFTDEEKSKFGGYLTHGE